MAFLTLSLALVSTAAAAGTITLTPTTQAPSGSVTVDGTSFGATKAVGIGLGGELAGRDADMAYSGTGTGPYSGRVANYPVKPGSFVLYSDTTSGGGLVSIYNDNGDGTLTGSFEGATGTIDYVTGNWSRSTTVDVTGIVTNYTATYTHRTNVTPAAGITTLPSGAFSASITLPAFIDDGSYPIWAVDTQGNVATSNLVVDHTVPEGLTIGVMMLLSTVAVIVGTRYYRKRPKWENW
ncbi:MAG TPA: hypothetical protein VGB11_07530 [Candidatus Bathyarchaeia archaeon]